MRWIVVLFNKKMVWEAPTIRGPFDDKLKARAIQREVREYWQKIGWQGEAVLFMERR